MRQFADKSCRNTNSLSPSTDIDSTECVFFISRKQRRPDKFRIIATCSSWGIFLRNTNLLLLLFILFPATEYYYIHTKNALIILIIHQIIQNVQRILTCVVGKSERNRYRQKAQCGILQTSVCVLSPANLQNFKLAGAKQRGIRQHVTARCVCRRSVAVSIGFNVLLVAMVFRHVINRQVWHRPNSVELCVVLLLIYCNVVAVDMFYSNVVLVL